MSPDRDQRSWLFGGIALVVLLVLSAAGGSYFTPTKTVEKVRVETVVQEKVVVQEKIVVKREVIQAKARVIVRTVRELIHPDGTVERESKTEAKSASIAAAAAQATTDKSADVRRDEASLIDRTKSVERYDPMWKVGLLGGAEFSAAAPAPVVGVQGGVRLWVFWGTAQIQTQGKTLTVLGGLAIEL